MGDEIKKLKGELEAEKAKHEKEMAQKEAEIKEIREKEQTINGYFKKWFKGDLIRMGENLKKDQLTSRLDGFDKQLAEMLKKPPPQKGPETVTKTVVEKETVVE